MLVLAWRPRLIGQRSLEAVWKESGKPGVVDGTAHENFSKEGSGRESVCSCRTVRYFCYCSDSSFFSFFFFSFWLTCVRLLVPLQMLCWSSLHKIRVWFPRNLRNVDSQNSIKSWDILCQHLLSDFHSCVEETVYICSETYAKIILYSLSSGHPLLYATENIREQPHCTV